MGIRKRHKRRNCVLSFVPQVDFSFAFFIYLLTITIRLHVGPSPPPTGNCVRRQAQARGDKDGARPQRRLGAGGRGQGRARVHKDRGLETQMCFKPRYASFFLVFYLLTIIYRQRHHHYQPPSSLHYSNNSPLRYILFRKQRRPFSFLFHHQHFNQKAPQEGFHYYHNIGYPFKFWGKDLFELLFYVVGPFCNCYRNLCRDNWTVTVFYCKSLLTRPKWKLLKVSILKVEVTKVQLDVFLMYQILSM